MGMFKVRYLVAKRQKSRVLYYWQPNKPLRDAGFLPRRLAERTNDLADAIRQAEALNRELDAWRAGQQPVPVQPDTVPWLVKLYRSDPRYTDLAAKTQRGYDQCLAIIEGWSERAGHPPLGTLQRKSVKAFYRSMSATPSKASAVLRVLRLLLAFAVDEGEIGRNPAEKMRLKVSAPRDQVWTSEQIEAFVTAANANGRASIGLAAQLGAGLGQREGDCIRFGWTQYDGACVRLRQRKTGKLISVPTIADLRQALDAAPRSAATIVVSETTGRPYTEDNFTHLFREIANAAELPRDLQFRDLRRTAVVSLAEAGCSVPEIAAITGHSLRTATQILETYLPRNSTMAKNAITRLEEHRARTKLEA
jgi:integrase